MSSVGELARRQVTVVGLPALGLAHEVGSLEVGKLANIVLWEPARFGATPRLVLKARFPAYGLAGDPNAAVEHSQPTVIGPQFGGSGSAPPEISVAFVSNAAMAQGDHMPTGRRRVSVRGTRGIGLADMRLNSRTARVDVDASTGAVEFDGEPISSEPAETVSLSRLYFL
jgi:urease subunit alpha